MKNMKIAIAMAALACGTDALAENLIWFGRSQSGAEYYYDSDSIRMSKNVVFVWTIQDAGKDKTVQYQTMRARIALNCQEEKFDIPSGVTYYSDRNESWNNKIINMVPIVPSSFNEAIYKIICRK